MQPTYKYLYSEEGREAEALEHNEQLTPTSIIIRDENKGVFIHFETLGTYKQAYEGTEYLTHEIIFSHQVQKPKFDIDGGDIKSYDDILEFIEALFQETYDLAPEIVQCDSSSPQKFSRHIVINNAAFANTREAAHFTSLFKDQLPSHLHPFVDWGVNKSTQNFRTPGSIKADGRKKRVKSPHTYDDAMITNCEGLPVLPCIAPKEVLELGKLLNITPEHRAIIMEAVDPNTWELNEGRSTADKLRFDRRPKSPSYCESCKRVHESANMFIRVFPNAIRQFCYRTADKGKPKPFPSHLIWEAPKINEIPALNQDEIIANIRKQIDREQFGHAELFAEAHKDTIIITNVKNGGGYVFNAKNALWEPKHDCEIAMLIPPFLESQFNDYRRALTEQYAVVAEPAQKKELNKMISDTGKRIQKVLTRSYVADVFAFAKNKLYVKDFEYTKNSIPYLLPVQGAQVVDLRTGIPEPRQKEHRFTFECPWEFTHNPDPKVQQYMADLMNDDPEMLAFFQKTLGYCLTGETKEKSLFVMFGASGDNGKSKLLNIIEKLMGPFFASVSKYVFIKGNEKDRHANAHTAHLMPIVGARIIAVSELSEGDVLNDGNVKNLTGDDTMRLRAPNDKESIQYRPICKPIIISNHKPHFDIKDQAMQNRMKYIPFKAQFKANPAPGQKKANTKLIDELSGPLLGHIGSWMIEGAVKYYQEGLDLIEALQKYKEQQINELDSTARFLQEECEDGPEFVIKASEIYNAYNNWCRQNNLVAETNANFGVAMKKKYEQKRRNTGLVYVGLHIKPADEEEGNEAIIEI